jgi:two-component system alkaline phosphatase synthesis response regulator PhoP
MFGITPKRPRFFELFDELSAAVSEAAREFAILGHFIRHRGKVVSREELLTCVWHHESPPETRTVDTHMGQLRKKIEKVASKPRFLVSVRGAGYRFEG